MPLNVILDQSEIVCCGSESNQEAEALKCIDGQCYRGGERCWNYWDQPMCNLQQQTDSGWNTCQESIKQSNIDKVQAAKSPIHLAALHGRTEALQWLLQEGEDVNRQLNDGSTPLHVAALTSEGEDVVHFLLSNGADSRLVNSSGATPLHWFTQYGRIRATALILSQSGDPNSLNQSQNSPLHMASFQNHQDIAQLLLAFGANPNIQNAHGRTPFEVGLFSMAQPPFHMI
ncbi:ankyrin domain protein [Thraustotheca clavata]|uniref:Ankyrin domain protein n=1 Tax=Thraustotheca clavata TaxID=74557 RepID=A0A1V9YUN5_9STRA|nr:ankyrin domain protein [Thraustotheca clavata]